MKQLLQKLCMLFCIIVTSSPGFSQDLARTGGLKKGETEALAQENYRTLNAALAEIESKFKVKFDYNSDVVSDKLISIQAVNNDAKTVEEALTAILKPLNLKFEKYDGNSYLILPSKGGKKQINKIDKRSPIEGSTENTKKTEEFARLTPAQLVNIIQIKDVVVKGKVTANEDQSALPGVNVIVKGTSIGSTTDVEGNFSLNVPNENVILVFSFIGYTTEEIPLNGRTTLDVSLLSDIKQLSEVVVVGYGTQKRQDVTAAISSVPMKELKDMPVSNVANALQGKIPGVVIQQNTGAPGSTPAIKVRGFGSISAGNAPLIVVDGNIVDPSIFSLLNSNDIESIDVLKDASSAAIYGSKGGNGVIMVTTKRGKSGTTNISVDAFTGFQEVTKKMDLLNSQQYAEFAKEAANTAYLDNVAGANISDPNSARPSNFLRYRYPRGDLYDWFNFDDPTKVANLPYNDFQDMIFQKAKIQNYQVTASGGTDKVQFLISGGYLQQEGIVKGSNLDRYTLRANVDVNVTSKLRMGMNLNPSYKVLKVVNTDGHWASNGIINAALSAIPMSPIYAADGTTYSSQTELAAPYGYPGITNPIANIKENHSDSLSANLLANMYAEYKLLDNLTYRISGNINFGGGRRDSYRTSKMPLNQLLPPTTATGSSSSDQSINILFNQIVNYNKTFNDAHNVDLLVGMEATRLRYQRTRGEGSSYGNDVVETLNASANGSTTNALSFKTENTSASYFARVGYSYKSRYLVNISVRRDGSSIFGPENRWGTFPAASLGWRVIEESFMKGIPVLSETKLRVSYGLSGNNSFRDNYPYVALLRSDNYSFNNNLANGLAPSSLSNPQLGWEKNQQLDAGIDIGLFNDRIYFIADYYHRVTKDLLLSVNVPSVTGFSSVYQNIGEMENTGWEFAVNTRNLTGELSWNSNLNISFNRNKVVALGPTGDPIRSGSGIGETHITIIGEPIGSFYGFKQIGIFQNQADLDNHPHDPTSRPGDVKYEDVTGDGKITADDRTIIGNNQPDFIYSINNTLTFKNFDFNISLVGTQGGEILNLSRRFFENLEGNANQMTTVLNRWRSESQPGDGVTPRANARTAGNNNAVSTKWIEDGSYLRIQNISLGYQLPQSLLNQARIQQARVYVSAQNLYTWSKYLGYNPEVSNYEGALTGGVDYGNYPMARTFTIGVNLTF